MRIFGRLAGGVAAALTLAGVLGVAQTAQAAQAAASPPNPTAQSAVLANATTGAWLWSRHAFEKRAMGSITKVMTALIVIEDGKLSRQITVPSGIIAYDEEFNASTAGLVPGEKLTALQLLYALMLPSGCDAAYTLATAYGGGNRASGSGPCLLFEARRGTKTLIGVVLHSKLPPTLGLDYAFSDAAALLTWGFSQ
jgi:D-alanyl-D-alanine carboxypeptidase (penicillin-binding protein 5/6)